MYYILVDKVACNSQFHLADCCVCISWHAFLASWCRIINKKLSIRINFSLSNVKDEWSLVEKELCR